MFSYVVMDKVFLKFINLYTGELLCLAQGHNSEPREFEPRTSRFGAQLGRTVPSVSNKNTLLARLEQIQNARTITAYCDLHINVRTVL